jgi:hypothetical protein
MTDTVITPLLHGSRAVELGNGMFRKRVLPVGSVEYQGRQLKFSRDYLSGLVDAFRDRAYDFCPIQIADASNKHTNSPEATRGRITDMTLEPDGLWITAELGADGERVLSQYPEMGVSARIVENYARSDGKFYPAALQHALITLDPRVPALGAWQAVADMSNGPQMVFDLSQSSWTGEPGPSYALSGIDDELSPRELAELDQVLAEVEAEAYQEQQDALSEYDETFTANWAAEQALAQARADADADDAAMAVIRMKSGHTESAEARMSRLVSRAVAGTYDTSHAALSHDGDEDRAIELTATTGQGLCGPPDAFGRCSSPQHQAMCLHDISVDWMAAEVPHRDTYAMALSNFMSEHDDGSTPAATFDLSDPDGAAYAIPQRTLELAHRFNIMHGLLGDTFDGPNLPQQDAYKLAAGEDGYPRPQLPGGYADIRSLAKGMGLR